MMQRLQSSALSVSLWLASCLGFNESYISHIVNTEAHKIQTLTAMQIPPLHNWMCFRQLVTSNAVRLSENFEANFQTNSTADLRLFCLSLMKAKHNQRAVLCTHTTLGQRWGKNQEWKSDLSLTRSAHTLHTHASYSALFFSSHSHSTYLL